MAIKKPTTTRDLSKDLAGPPATAPTPTVQADQAPVSEQGNLTGSGPDEVKSKTVKLTAPAGTKVTVSADLADALKAQGYKASK